MEYMNTAHISLLIENRSRRSDFIAVAAVVSGEIKRKTKGNNLNNLHFLCQIKKTELPGEISAGGSLSNDRSF